MPKPNETMTLKDMRQYVRDKKLNHPDVRLGMNRAELIAGLKKAGHWDDSKKKLDKGQKSFLAGIDDGKKKSKAKPSNKTKKKKETRKPPPKLNDSKGNPISWKMKESSVNDKENFWEWEARGEDSIETPGETTTYTYLYDSLATSKDYNQPEKVRKGVIYSDEDNDNYYTIPEFTRKYKKLQTGFGKELSVDKYTTKYKNRSLKSLRKLLKDAQFKNEKKAIKEIIEVKEFMSS